MTVSANLKEVKVYCKGVHIVEGRKIICGCQGTNKTFHRISTPNHGDVFFCPDCYHKMEGYETKNDLRVNGKKKHGFTVSIEMELTAHDDAFDRFLQYNNFKPTSDCTVAIEYKSPIYQSLNGVRKLFRSLCNGVNTRDYFDYRCGTHCNIGHDAINSQTIVWLIRFYHSLFLPMSRWLELNPVASEALYGRQIGGWASPINEHTDPLEHTNFINLQHFTHIEFRQCKFINENQYVDLIQLNTKIVKALLNNFVEHFDDDDFDTRRYKNITEFRKHKATLTGKKIVSLLEKECQKRNIPYTSL